jgi:hypothetical protein
MIAIIYAADPSAAMRRAFPLPIRTMPILWLVALPAAGL